MSEIFVKLELLCFDTMHPTVQPTLSPTFSPTTAPTTSPTEVCGAIIIHGTQVDYDGVYNKMVSAINGFDWWQSRDDVGGIGVNQRVKLYYYH